MTTAKPPVIVAGMWGVGDVIHQRAVVRELMKSHDVWLETFNCAAYHDLVDQGLKVRLLTTMRPRIRESTRMVSTPPPPAGSLTPRHRMTYGKASIEKAGSILAAQFASCGLTMPIAPDFSLPIPTQWQAKAQHLIDSWDLRGRPLLIYRPAVLNNVWRCTSRCPDPGDYAALFQRIRRRFFVVSFADLAPDQEWIVGDEQDADVKLHAGELDFETLAALFAEADLAFVNPGFAPVLAQAVGTPAVVVYGGHESSKTTQRTGAHLAPSLFIEPATPCDCHLCDHDCDKRINLAPAHARIDEFINRHVTMPPRVLIFATTYVDSVERAQLLDRWLSLTTRLNPSADILLVDSCSPLPIAEHQRWTVHNFLDNIGHLARKGRDGWGRAFCYGLEAAIAGGYDYAVHIEGDSLFRLPVAPIVKQMQTEKIMCASIPVSGTKRHEPGWVETGLMFFDVQYLVSSQLVVRYDWQRRTSVPTPETVIAKLLGTDLRFMSWRGQRDDQHLLTPGTAAHMDWITHCSDMAIYEAFYDHNTAGG